MSYSEIALRILVLFLRGVFLGLVIGYASAFLFVYSARAEVNQVVATIVRESAKYNLDPKLVAAVIKIESNWRSDAMSKTGDHGLMQLNRRYFANVTTIEQNLILGISHLAWTRDHCPHNVNLTWLSCYNSGINKHPKYPHLNKYYIEVNREYQALQARRLEFNN